MATARVKPRRDPIIEFVTETRDYNIEYYCTKFSGSLPQTVMITAGFQGENDAHVFTKGQVLRLITESRQKCSIAKAVYNGEPRFFTIPLCYQTCLRVLGKNRTAGKEMPLYDLVEKYSLPFTAQFAEVRQEFRIRKGKQDKIKKITTKDIPVVQILQVYDAVCLLGNFLINGKTNPDVADIPLYLSKIRVAIVTGIKGKTKEEYVALMEEVDLECEYVEYDLEFGSAEITAYAGDTQHCDTLYTPLEPDLYANTAAGDDDDTDTGIYEEISHSAGTILSTEQFKSELLTAAQKRKSVPIQKPPVVLSNARSVLPKPPAILPKPSAAQKPGKYLHRPKQALPEICHRASKSSTNRDKAASKTDNKNIYANILPKGTVSPITSEKIITQKLKGEIQESTTNSNVLTKNNDSKTALSGNNVANLSINDLGEYLEKLKLDKYKEAFRDQLIDGNMLVELDKDILKEEFGFSSLEALRLIKFAKDGRVPT